MGGFSWRWAAALLSLAAGFSGCSKITLLRTQELRKVEDQVKSARKEIADLQKSVDDLNLSQGGLTSKMRADLTSMISDLQTQISRLHSEIDETQHRLGQLGQKLDKLDQRKVLLSGDSIAGGAPSLKIVDGLDLDNLFNQAREDYIRGKYDLAHQGFKTVNEKDPSGTYKELALYWMAECLWKGEKFDRALEMYQRVIKEFPKGGKACAARFKIGLIHDAKKDGDRRNDAFKQLISECPQSNEAQRAKEMMGS
jgi:TolA-binding protein